MSYPLGPFPSEILLHIVRLSRDFYTYQNLCLTSKRIKKVVQPLLPEIASQPISTKEILNNNQILLFSMTANLTHTLYSPGVDLPRIQYLLREYPIIFLTNIYRILQKRRECMEFDPNYAKKVILKFGIHRCLRYARNIHHGLNMKVNYYRIKDDLNSLNYNLDRNNYESHYNEIERYAEPFANINILEKYIRSTHNQLMAKIVN